ncbi:unnamed protein product, partial [Mesorhabditis belari]|uniref:Peptidase M13 C-terminal domain-containing protein n=1 Tax=Mesorhabditis belari TaxID=2138241 RepID=A0AAF3F4U0_9BILA
MPLQGPRKSLLIGVTESLSEPSFQKTLDPEVIAYLKRDLFLEHIQIFRNKSVDPCENFYRHICPATIQEDQTISYRYIPPQIRKTLEFPVGEVEVGLGPILEDISLNDEKQYAQFLQRFISGLRPFGKLVKYVNDYKLLNDTVYAKLRKKIRKMSKIMRNDVEQTSNQLMSPQTKLRFERISRTMMVILGKSNANKDDIVYQNLYTLLSKLWNQLYGKHLSYEKVAMQLGNLISAFYEVSPVELYAISLSHHLNAFNFADRNTLKIPITGCLFSQLARNSPSFYGGIGFTLAHEMYHNFFTEESLMADIHLLEGKQCLDEHKEAVCREIGDTDGKLDCSAFEEKLFKPCDCQAPQSLKPTYFEDVVDRVGIQLAFKAMREEIGVEKLTEFVYPEHGITNEQMFFYAHAIKNCHDAPYQWRSYGEPHEGAMMRVNQLVTLSPEFNKAFKCSSQSMQAKLMNSAGRTQCNQVGPDVLKRLFAKN